MLTITETTATDQRSSEPSDPSIPESVTKSHEGDPSKTRGRSAQEGSSQTGVFLVPRFNRVPTELQREFRWAVWLAEPRQNQAGKFKKAPRSPFTGKYLKVNEPDSFSDFEACRSAVEQHGYTGIGLLLEGNGWIGVDIDNFDRMSGADRAPILTWIRKALDNGAYVERSPSGSGVRAIFKGKFSGSGRKVGDLEIYQTGRFLTITGHAIEKDGGEENE